MNKLYLSWEDIDNMSRDVSKKINYNIITGKYDRIVCVGRGAMVFSRLLSEMCSINNITFMNVGNLYSGTSKVNSSMKICDISLDMTKENVLVVDDCMATGTTYDAVRKSIITNNKPKCCHLAVLMADDNQKPSYVSKTYNAKDTWIVFPWEKESWESNNIMNVKIKRLTDTAKVPVFATEGSAGCDLYATKTVEVVPGETMIIPTGISLEIPKGYEAQVRPRSGLSVKTKLRVANAPGTIDSDYRGEIGVIIDNIGEFSQTINAGDRIAQLVFTKHESVTFVETEQLEGSGRGVGGFGSTGTN